MKFSILVTLTIILLSAQVFADDPKPECSEHCKECESEDICTTCDDTFIKNFKGEQVLCHDGCMENLFFNKEKTECHECNIEKCDTCQDLETCKNCNSGWYPELKDDGEFDKCEECSHISGCKSCENDQKKCTECAGDKVFDSDDECIDCIESKGQLYYPEEKDCAKETSCKKDYYKEKGQCLKCTPEKCPIKEDEGLPHWVIGIIAFGGVLLIALIAFLLLQLRKKRQQRENDYANMEYEDGVNVHNSFGNDSIRSTEN